MKPYLCRTSCYFLLCLAFVFFALPLTANAQKQNYASAPSAIQRSVGGSARVEVVAVEDLPETPVAQFDPSAMPEVHGAYAGQNSTAPTASPAAVDSSSSPAIPAGQAAKDAGTAEQLTPQPAKSQKALAEEQIHQQQKQRILGVVPNFNTSYVFNAASLTVGQKFRLAFNTMTDSVQFATAGILALYSQADGTNDTYGGGIGGFAKRFGASYADNFDGTMLGNAVFPSLLHQDPRYFRLGYGSKTHRLLYALATNVICRHDNTGKWEPNYSNVLGNIAAGGISNLYAPPDERGVTLTFTNGLLVTAEGGFGSIFQEFWPDISRKYLHRDPTNGQDAANNAAKKSAGKPATGTTPKATNKPTPTAPQ
uniref:Uncharacterized protein n=1 Tax=mine drainage metagenome TaxID=410659 RepID=E6QMT1_9ZZZZ